MFNLGGGEVLVILLVALIVLGPTKLPDAVRQVGRVMGELRKISDSFQRELREAAEDPAETAARGRGAQLVAQSEARKAAAMEDEAKRREADRDRERAGSGTADPALSTAAAAGMYDATTDPQPSEADDSAAEAEPEIDDDITP